MPLFRKASMMIAICFITLFKLSLSLPIITAIHGPNTGVSRGDFAQSGEEPVSKGEFVSSHDRKQPPPLSKREFVDQVGTELSSFGIGVCIYGEVCCQSR